MNILTCAPTNCSFCKIECCVCKKGMNICDSTSHIITKSGYFVCNDCVDKAVEAIRLHKKSNLD